MAKVTANCRGLASAFYKAGFRVQRCEAFVLDEKAYGDISLLVIFAVVFSGIIPAVVFQHLPTGFYFCHSQSAEASTTMIYNDSPLFHRCSISGRYREVRKTLQPLKEWLLAEQESGRLDIFGGICQWLR